MLRTLAAVLLASAALASSPSQAAAVDADAIEGVVLASLIDEGSKGFLPAMVKLQVLLDRAGASPGVIDGVSGDNVDKALVAIEKMNGLTEDGLLDAELIAALEETEATLQTYEIRDEDVSDLVDAIPEDYAEKAKLKYLGFTSGAEAVAERFHMDVDLLVALNPGASFVAGEKVLVANVGTNKSGKVVRIEADKERRQVRAYDAGGKWTCPGKVESSQ